MNITYIISYVFLIVCMYIGEFLIFGLWYKLYSKSSVSYFTFFKKMLRYYRYRVKHLFGKAPVGEPESSSLLFLIVIVVPVVFPTFVLLTESWVIRCVTLLVGIGIVAGFMFREEKTLTEIQINRWIRFLYSSECRSLFKDEKNGDARRRQQKEKNDYYPNQSGKKEESQSEETPLSKEELKKGRLKLIPVGIIALSWGISLFVGIITDVENGMFGKRKSPLVLFASETHNIVFGILTVVLFVTMLIYLFSDKDFRNEEKERVVEYIDGKQRKARNILGFGKGIYMDSALAEWEDAVTRMCRVLDIRLVVVVSEACVTEGFSGRIAMTVADPDGVPTVVLSTRMIGKLRTKYSPQMVYDIVRFLIGHELTHVRYKDYNKKWSVVKAFAAFTIIFAAIAVCIIAITHLPDSMTLPGVCLLLFILLFAWLFQKNVMNDCYRNYVSEYRADRKSAEISGASRSAMEAALQLDIDRDDKVKTDRFGKKRNTHPYAEHRIKELQRGKKWGMSEYFRYAIRVEW